MSIWKQDIVDEALAVPTVNLTDASLASNDVPAHKVSSRSLCSRGGNNDRRDER